MTESKAAAAKKDADEADEAVTNEADVLDAGYRGVQADKTPNENYTVAGVLAGKPTPETDSK